MIYALLIYSQASDQAPLTGDPLEATLVQHRALQTETAKGGQLLSVAQLQEPLNAKTVRFADAGHMVCDGPYVETKEWLASTCWNVRTNKRRWLTPNALSLQLSTA